MRTRLARILSAAALAAPLLLGTTRAHAHAILVESTPVIGATVAPGEIAMRLRFNSRIDRARSRLTLTRPDHSTQILPIANQGTDDLLFTTITLPPGAYTVRWQVLAVDGHITRGDVAFRVEGAAP
jgi:methionine-rich copper-binding protein CopC